LRKNSDLGVVLKGRGFSRAVTPQNQHRLYSFLKSPSLDFVLKGRGFKPRRKCHQINAALAVEGARRFFRSLPWERCQPCL